MPYPNARVWYIPMMECSVIAHYDVLDHDYNFKMLFRQDSLSQPSHAKIICPMLPIISYSNLVRQESCMCGVEADLKIAGLSGSQPMKGAGWTQWPKQVYLIMSSEVCERFSFYGMRAILVSLWGWIWFFTNSAWSLTAFHALLNRFGIRVLM